MTPRDTGPQNRLHHGDKRRHDHNRRDTISLILIAAQVAPRSPRYRVRENPLDVVWEFEASRDYDPATNLDRIQAPLLAVNFADDAVNPAELGVMDRMISHVRNGQALLLPATATSTGHQTLTDPSSWVKHLRDLLQRTGKQAKCTPKCSTTSC